MGLFEAAGKNWSPHLPGSIGVDLRQTGTPVSFSVANGSRFGAARLYRPKLLKMRAWTRYEFRKCNEMSINVNKSNEDPLL